MNLRDIRLRNHITQVELAKRVGITGPYYSMLETGERRPSPEVAKRIAKILGFEKYWYKLLDTDASIIEEAAT